MRPFPVVLPLERVGWPLRLSTFLLARVLKVPLPPWVPFGPMPEHFSVQVCLVTPGLVRPGVHWRPSLASTRGASCGTVVVVPSFVPRVGTVPVPRVVPFVTMALWPRVHNLLRESFLLVPTSLPKSPKRSVSR